MNQRTLTVLSLTTSGGHLITNAAWVPGLVVDLAAGDGVTTSTWTYANIGRREMKVVAFIQKGPIGTTAVDMSTYNAWVQTATTGAFTGTLTTEAGPMTATTYGPTNELHFQTNNRYMRLLHNAATPTSCTISALCLIEQRAS
jgi:hypothetical protein